MLLAAVTGVEELVHPIQLRKWLQVDHSAQSIGADRFCLPKH